MLSKADNELLCRVGPGTPMGELFRRFWLPALLASELPSADCPPVRVRLLCENLVAFRDSTGQVGFVAENCPHRGASLFFGRNEECGIRCVYHGWKFDTSGACVDMPNEPPESNFKHKVRVTAYPAREYGSLIWIYMGPRHLEPELPQLEWALVPDGYRHLSKWYHDSNYAQGMEGEIDTSHISFLHRFLDPSLSPFRAQRGARQDLARGDGAPQLTLKETDYGFVYGARRTTADSDYYWRITQWLLPNFSLIPAPGPARGGRCWIPIDDEHTWAYGYQYRMDRPYTDEEREQIMAGRAFPPRLIPGTFQPLANKTNDWLIDRELQRTGNFTGIWGINEQDRALQEDQAMAPIADRNREHLGTADIAIITARRMLLRLARRLQEGIEPFPPSHGEIYRVRALDTLDTEENFHRLLARYENDVVASAVVH